MKINSPKISIVIPSFNQGQFIEETLLSIINQSYTNWEIIVMDGGSSDQTVDILQKYDSNITKWVSEPDQGQAHAINKGLEYCTGELFNWINSDDYLMPRALEDLANLYRKFPHGQIFCGYTYCFFDETKKESHTYRMKFGKKVEDVFFDLEMNQPGSFVLTEMVKAVGGVNESLRYVFDNELYYRLLCKYGNKGVVNSDNTWAGFRLHGDSKSVGEGFEGFEEERLGMLGWVFREIGSIGTQISMPDTGKYQPRDWSWNYLDVKRFSLRVLASRLLSVSEKEGKAATVRIMIQLMQMGCFQYNRKNISLFFRQILGFS